MTSLAFLIATDSLSSLKTSSTFLSNLNFRLGIDYEIIVQWVGMVRNTFLWLRKFIKCALSWRLHWI